MIGTYNPGFAKFYNAHCGGFAREVAPRILDFYAATPLGQQQAPVLDLCCGAGHLAVFFLRKGYQVTGIDCSEPMLNYARANACSYIQSGQARFIAADATEFCLDERFGLVISTYDALNHLEDETTLKACFQRVYDVSEGYFIFDLNTQAGLQRWNSIQVDENEEMTRIVQKTFQEKWGKALAKFICFLRTPDGFYERVEETVSNTLFRMDRVKQLLESVGWKSVCFTRFSDLSEAIAEPEAELRVFIVAHK
jgi:ubiquinone/menaquinone biosynthesis C-methylase UbiE